MISRIRIIRTGCLLSRCSHQLSRCLFLRQRRNILMCIHHRTISSHLSCIRLRIWVNQHLCYLHQRLQILGIITSIRWNLWMPLHWEVIIFFCMCAEWIPISFNIYRRSFSAGVQQSSNQMQSVKPNDSSLDVNDNLSQSTNDFNQPSNTDNYQNQYSPWDPQQQPSSISMHSSNNYFNDKSKSVSTFSLADVYDHSNVYLIFFLANTA